MARSINPLTQRFWAKVHKTDTCWIWTASYDSWGYGHIKIGAKAAKANRVAWELTYGSIPEGMCVLHRCDNPACVRPEHLFLGTNADNVKDRTIKGRSNHPRGSRNGRAILTEEQVLAIRTEFRPHVVTRVTLAKQYGVSEGCIHGVLYGENWQHI
jgi:hypothetical protein